MKTGEPYYGSGKTKGNRMKSRGESWLKYRKQTERKTTEGTQNDKNTGSN